MMLRRIFLLSAIAGAISLTAFGQNETVVIRPEPIDEVIVNPGMGITTFQRFNGQPLNQGLQWSEAGPTAKQSGDSARSVFPDTSVASCRWFWTELQPPADPTRWEIIDPPLSPPPPP